MAGTPIDELINNLYEMVEDAWAMPLGNDRCVLEREKVLDILDEVRANLPSDLKMAREIVEKRNDIIAAGKKEYDNLKKQADEYAKQKVNDHEIIQSVKIPLFLLILQLFGEFRQLGFFCILQNCPRLTDCILWDAPTVLFLHRSGDSSLSAQSSH